MCLIACIMILDYSINQNSIPLIYFANVRFNFKCLFKLYGTNKISEMRIVLALMIY